MKNPKQDHPSGMPISKFIYKMIEVKFPWFLPVNLHIADVDSLSSGMVNQTCLASRMTMHTLMIGHDSLLTKHCDTYVYTCIL